MRRGAAACLLFLTISGCASQPVKRPPPAAAAHRGDRECCPDNSLEAILSAAKHGVEFIEIDIRQSRDGSLFLFHDRRLRTENAKAPAELLERPVESLSDAELAKVTLPTRSGAAEPIAYFHQALECLRPFSSLFLLDVKGKFEAIYERVIRTVIGANMEARAVLQCPTLEAARTVRTRYPALKILVKPSSPEELEQLLLLRPEIVQFDLEDFSPSHARRARDARARVLVKAVEPLPDDEVTWRRLFEQGADILLTDRAPTLSRFLQSRIKPSTLLLD